MSAQNPEPVEVSESGVNRRGLMRNAAQLGVAGIAAGVVLNATNAFAAEPAAVPTTSAAAAIPASHEPLMAHVRDASTGELDVFHGDQHRRVIDRELAAALLRYAR